MEIKQYEIVLVNLDPTVGSEIRKTRPCTIISPDEMNRYLHTIVVAPITSQSKQYPTRVGIKQTKTTDWIVLDQIRTIDISRIVKKIGHLSLAEIEEVKSVIMETYVK